MSCAACQATIQNKLSKTKGVNEVNVRLLSNDMQISYDEETVTLNDLANIIKGLGYELVLTENKEMPKKTKSLKKSFFISLALLLVLMYFSMGSMIKLPQPTFLGEVYYPIVVSLLQLCLVIPILILNKHFFVNGFRATFKAHPNMDSLVALGSLASFVYSLVLTILIVINPEETMLNHERLHHLFYESAGMILTLVTLGKALEAKAKSSTGKEIEKLSKLIPDTVNLVKGTDIKTISINELLIDDIIIVRNDEYIPIDGIVIEGNSFIDTSALSGESMPIEVKPSDYVSSATIVKGNALKIQVKKIKDDTTIAKIIKVVKEAGTSKARVEKLADKISLYFVPIVCLISVVTFIIWMIIGKGDFPTAINMAISVLVISCPCALGLATPMAIMVGTGVGAKHGILYKNAETIEKVNLIKKVMFDKTGTLTKGFPEVIDYLSLIDKDEFLQIAASIESLSNHPLANSVSEFFIKNNLKRSQNGQNTLSLLKVNQFDYLYGLGTKAMINNTTYFLGNINLLKKNQIIIDSQYLSDLTNKYPTQTIIYLANKELLGAIVIADELKDNSKELMLNLKHQHLSTAMITGDQKNVAEYIAKELGIDEVYAEVLPVDKYNIIKENQVNQLVAFVGDGINDTPALKQADIGIAISKISSDSTKNSNFELALESADIVIASSNINNVSTMFDLSKHILNTIKGNLFWAFIYNVIGISIASGMFYNLGLKLNPMVAALAMSLSSLFVCTNALRLNLFKIKKEKRMTIKVYINGMMCNHCAERVKKALLTNPSVQDVEVNLKKHFASVSVKENISTETFKEIIEQAGYEFVKVES